MGGGGEGYFTNYPKHVFLILTCEFCERFSYYGMKAILVLFMTNALHFSDDTATAIYHSFNVVCYFTPIFGAMVSDGWLGKYKTILYVSIIYGIGNIIMTLSAIPINGEYSVWLPFVGLTLIAIGTGGIKPCVSAFGGDQFTPEQQRQKDSFFSLFYMAINIGSLLSTIITPIIRSNVFCFGSSCYALAFGIPAALMIISIFVFAPGYRWYTMIPPGDNILGRMFGCTWVGMKGKFSCSSNKVKREHWLDYAVEDYGETFVADMKDVMRVLWLFLPLPIFWALFDQQGSRWTLQATQMNGEFGGFVMQPDMMQVFNPLFVVTVVPLLESVIYPCLDKIHIPNSPLQRMGWGMIFAGTAFLLAGFLQIGIDYSAAKPAGKSEAQVMFINSASCNYTVTSNGSSKSLSLGSGEGSSYEYITMNATAANLTFTMTSTDSRCKTFNVTKELTEETGYELYITTNGTDLWHTQEKERLTQTEDQSSAFHFYNNMSSSIDIFLQSEKGQQGDVWLYNITQNNVSDWTVLVFAKFHMTVFHQGIDGNHTIDKAITSRNGAVYTVIVSGVAPIQEPDPVGLIQLTEVDVWTLNIFWQVPQYFIMTTGECLFSVTGLAFAYSQAPLTMKSILQAAWLLTVAIGNVVVIIVAETGGAMSQVAEFFLFSGLMYVTDVIFIIMALFYEYITPREIAEDEVKSRSNSKSSKSSQSADGDDIKSEKLGVDNKGMEISAKDVILDDDDDVKKKKPNGDVVELGAAEKDSSDDDGSNDDGGSTTAF